MAAWETKERRPRFIPRMPSWEEESRLQPRMMGGVVWEFEREIFSLTRLPSASVPSA